MWHRARQVGTRNACAASQRSRGDETGPLQLRWLAEVGRRSGGLRGGLILLVDTKLGPRWARGSEPWPVMSARVWDGVRGAGGGKGRAGGSRVSGRWDSQPRAVRRPPQG